MHRRSVVAVLLAPALAAADPEPFKIHIEGAGRLGVGTASWGDQFDARSGTGIYVDGEIGARLLPFLSVAVFGAALTFRASGSYTDLNTDTWDVRDSVFDLGARVHFRASNALFGIGFGHEWLRESGTYACVSNCGAPPSSAHATSWTDSTVYELHAGYVFPRVDTLHGRIEMLVVGAYSTESAMYVHDEKVSARVAVGLEL